MHPRIQHIAEMWYLSEPALFQIFGTHDIEENSSMKCPFRCGRGKIEYNPSIIDGFNNEILELYLKAEVIRILLKHPYERQPDSCRRTSMSLGSNMVLADNYDFEKIGLPKPETYDLPKEESYEWYSFQIEQQEKAKEGNGNQQNTNNNQGKIENLEGNLPDEGDEHGNDGDRQDNNINSTSDSEVGKSEDIMSNDIDGAGISEFDQIQLPDGTIMKLPQTNTYDKSTDRLGDEREEEKREFSNQPHSEDLSQLWEEDVLRSCEIDVAIDQISASNSWGSLAGRVSSMILANTKAKIDYRKVLSGFRASVLSTKRHLTRMRPNRRSGFDNMGSIRRFDTNLLVAVDVSGSVDDKSLSHFFSIINRGFKYGIDNIDVIQFDTELKEVEHFEKARKEVHVLGRGGTSFQPIIDFVAKHPEYDGLLIFTDGGAPIPKMPKNMRCKIAWVCNSLENYNNNKEWMLRIGRCCSIQI